MRTWRITIALVLATAFGAGCSTGNTEDSGGTPNAERVSVAIVTSAGFAPFYVSSAKKYFTDVGVAVETQVVKSGQDAIPLLAGGNVNVVIAGFSAGTFSALATGLEFKVVGSMNIASGDPARSTTGLYVDKRLVDNGTVRSVTDLKGRKVAVVGGSGAAGGYLLDLMLQPHGLGVGDVEVVNLGSPDMKTGLQTGGVAAAIPTAPFGSQISDSGVGVPLAVPPKGTSVTGVMFSERFVGQPAATAFLRALSRGAADLQGGKVTAPENVAILAEATGQKPEVLSAMPWDTWLTDLAPATEHIRRMQETYIRAGLLDLDEPISPDRFVLNIPRG